METETYLLVTKNQANDVFSARQPKPWARKSYTRHDNY